MPGVQKDIENYIAFENYINGLEDLKDVNRIKDEYIVVQTKFHLNGLNVLIEGLEINDPNVGIYISQFSRDKNYDYIKKKFYVVKNYELIRLLNFYCSDLEKFSELSLLLGFESSPGLFIQVGYDKDLLLIYKNSKEKNNLLTMVKNKFPKLIN